MKLLPFDLQRALAGDKVVTRDGREVTQLTKFEITENEYPLIGVVGDRIRSWTIKGQLFRDGRFAECDLFMAPTTVKRWVNFYETEHPDKSNGYAFKTEAAAKRAALSNAIAIAVPVEFEEGYGCE